MKRLQNLIAELEQFGLRYDLIQAGLPELGSDLAMPCFVLAQEQKAHPQQIAEEIAATLKHPQVLRVQAVKGYLNLWLAPGFLAQNLRDWQTQEVNLGQKPAGDQRVLVEYFSPNLAKAFSVGHLRNLFQGRALVNLHRVWGYEVITDNHLGDWGTTFGIWVVGWLKYSQQQTLEQSSLKELGRIYALTCQDLEKERSLGDHELADQVQDWLLRLENGDQEAWRYHRLLSAMSAQAMERVLKRLDIQFDHYLGESFYYQQTRALLSDLEERGLAKRQDDQSLIVDLSPQGIATPLLIQKSNGTILYASSDLATLAYREQHFQPQKVIYVVGAEQRLHFKQLFAFNSLAHLTQAELIHHAYGLVEERLESGKRQKMSSRKQAIALEDVLEAAQAAAARLTDKQLEPADVEIVAQGALAFQEFAQSKSHNILFDFSKIFSLTEMSGPYVQYATLRLRSILAKAAEKPAFPPESDYDWQAEHRLILKVLSFEDVLELALKSLEPSKVAFYAFELCQELNRYYEQVRVLESEPLIRASRLWLLATIHDHLVFTLGILGLKIPSRM